MLLQQRAAAVAGGGSAARRVAPLPPKRALGRARRAVRADAALKSAFTGQSIAVPTRAFRGQRAAVRSRGTVAVKAMFERFTEKAIKVVM
jgi:hypothetical protein